MEILKRKPYWIIVVGLLAIGLVIFPFHPAYAYSGGGCTTAHGVGSCVGENSSSQVVTPDAYINVNNICNVTIYLVSTNGIETSVLYSGCYGAGSHLIGNSASASVSHKFYTVVWVGSSYSVTSPTLTT